MSCSAAAEAPAADAWCALKALMESWLVLMSLNMLSSLLVNFRADRNWCNQCECLATCKKYESDVERALRAVAHAADMDWKSSTAPQQAEHSAGWTAWRPEGCNLRRNPCLAGALLATYSTAALRPELDEQEVMAASLMDYAGGPANIFRHSSAPGSRTRS